MEEDPGKLTCQKFALKCPGFMLSGKWKNVSADKVVKANCTSMGAIRTGDLSLNVNLSIVLTAGSGILECHGLDGGDWWCGSGGDGI